MWPAVRRNAAVRSDDLQTLLDVLTGVAGAGDRVQLTRYNNSSNYALDVRNLDTTNSYGLRVRDAVDANLLLVYKDNITVGANVTVGAGLTVDGLDLSAHAHTGAAGHGVQVAHTSLTAIGTNTHAQIDTHIAAADAPTAYPYLGIGTHADLSAEVDVQAMQIVNEIKGWPPIVAPDADLDALNLWWDKIGTPTTAPTVVDVAGEAGITETYELALKCVTDAASEGLSQRWTYADEPRVKSGRKLSVLLAIWSVSSVSVTAKLVNSDATETAASAVTAAAWTLVEIANHTLAGTYCDLQVTTAAAGTFYVVPLAACIGSRGLPLAPRPLRYVDGAGTIVVSGVDPGGAGYTDYDATANTSPLTCLLQIVAHYKNTTTIDKSVRLRRNGDGNDDIYQEIVRALTTAAAHSTESKIVPVDDAQIFEYKASNLAGDAEALYLSLKGYWEWA